MPPDIAADRRPRIVVLGVGGTIAMTAAAGGGVLPRLDAAALLAAVPGLAEIARVETVDIAVIPGPHITLEIMLQVREAVERAVADGVDGVVVIQGTDTIEETAFALQLLYCGDRPLVVTGALRHPAQPGADGPANLLDAVRVAAAPDTAGRGVLVALNATVHAAEAVTKTHVSRPDAFVSRTGAIGEVIESRVHFTAPPVAHGKGAARLCATPAPIALLPATVGDDGRLLRHLAPAGSQGLVIDGMGGGHMPPAMAARLEDLPREFPVVVASRTGGGVTLRDTYAYDGGEIDLARRGAIRAGHLSALKSRVALSLLLGAGADRSGIVAFFDVFGGGGGAEGAPRA